MIIKFYSVIKMSYDASVLLGWANGAAEKMGIYEEKLCGENKNVIWGCLSSYSFVYLQNVIK